MYNGQNVEDLMSVTDMTDIPKLYTAFAEWMVCLLLIFLLRDRLRLRGWKLGAVVAGSGVLLAVLQYLIGNVFPTVLWAPGMACAAAILYGMLRLCCVIHRPAALYCTAIVFTFAEFIAALEWQCYAYSYWWGYPSEICRPLFFVLFYGAGFAVFYPYEKRHLLCEGHLWVNDREAVQFALTSVCIFAASNISYISETLNISTPFSGHLLPDFFNTRTLVDFAGIFILLNLQSFRQESRMEREVESLNAILTRQYEQYQQSRENIEALNCKYHDMKHYISLMQAEQDPAQRDVFLREMQRCIRTFEAENKTGNPVLDTILTGKGLYCSQHNITLSSVADGEALSFVDTMDLCTIFGNLLDNAIEYVEQLPDPEMRLVRLQVYPREKFVVIRARNYCAEPPVVKNGLPVTTKGDGRYHGYGLKSVRRCTEKYQGTMTLQTDDNHFTVTLLLPKPEASAPRQDAKAG